MKEMQLKNKIVNKSISKNRSIMEELHSYLIKNNFELYTHLQSIGELEDFLIVRTDNAHKEMIQATDANAPYPNEFKNAALYIGIENSFCEYVESTLRNFPETFLKLEESEKYDAILNNLTVTSIPIFYKYLNTPYIEIQDQLDNELMKHLKEQTQNMLA